MLRRCCWPFCGRRGARLAARHRSPLPPGAAGALCNPRLTLTPRARAGAFCLHVPSRRRESACAHVNDRDPARLASIGDALSTLLCSPDDREDCRRGGWRRPVQGSQRRYCLRSPPSPLPRWDRVGVTPQPRLPRSRLLLSESIPLSLLLGRLPCPFPCGERRPSDVAPRKAWSHCSDPSRGRGAPTRPSAASRPESRTLPS